MAYLQLLPVLVLVCGLFLAGLFLTLVQSLGYIPPIGLNEITLAYYLGIPGDPAFQESLWLTLRVAVVATVGASAVGTALAVCLAQLARTSAWQRFFAQAPLAIPHLVAGYMVLTLLMPTGLLARILYAVGLIAQPDQFPALVYDWFGSGIIVAYVFKEAPFAAVLVYPLVAGATGRLQEAAITLGASPWQAFWRVAWPLIWPGVLSAGLIIFAYTVSAFEIPYVLGRAYPRALPVLAYLKYTSIDLGERPAAMALAVILTAITAIVAWLYLRLAYSAGPTLAQVRSGRDD